VSSHGWRDAGRAPPAEGGEFDVVERAVAALRAGLLVGIPTDTVYGLAAAIDHDGAIERLYTAKGRPRDKAIPVLVSGVAHVGKVSTGMTELAEQLARRFWPGPLTIVIPAHTWLHPGLTGSDARGARTVAVRLPDHPLARAVIEAAGGALAVTSANRSGQSPVVDARALLSLGPAAPDVIVDGGDTPIGSASTVVVATGAEPEIVREGVITAAAISAVVHDRARPGPSKRHDR
jgi:L-threonylcarbamoyladenylate synthase